MTAPGALNYPPDMVPVMQTFIRRAAALQDKGEEAKVLCDGLVNSSAGQAFVAMQAKFARINSSLDAKVAIATAVGNTSIQAHGDMMTTDNRVARMFE